MGKCEKKWVRGYAGGGEVKETPEQLIARISAKYGTSGAGQGAARASTALPPPPEPRPNPQPVPRKEQGIGGLIGLIRGRQDKIDKAVAAYARGGRIVGPGTPSSDSIPAVVRQTGEPIAVSNGERILSAEQDALMQSIARELGYGSLDALLEKGTGKPVGPVMKRGVAHAANGQKIGETDLDLKAVQDASIGQSRRNGAPAMNPAMANAVTGSRTSLPSVDGPKPITPGPNAAVDAVPALSQKPVLVMPPGSETAYTPEPGINPFSAIAQPIGQFFVDSANAARGSGTYEENRARSRAVAGVPAGDRSGVQERAFQPQLPASTPSTPSLTQAPAPPAPPAPLPAAVALAPNLLAERTPGTQSFAPGTAQSRAIASRIEDRGFVPESGTGLVRSGTGRAISIDSGIPQSPESLAQGIAQVRAPAPSITLDGLVQERARRALAGDLSGARGLSGSIAALATAAGAGLDAKIKQQTIDAGALDAQRQQRIVDAENAVLIARSPEEIESATAVLRALRGKEDKYAHATAGTTVDPATGLALKGEDTIYNERTGLPARSARPQAAPAYPEGTALRGRDGKNYVVKNGVPVPA